MKQELSAAFKKHFAEQDKRRGGLIRRALWWIATKPWLVTWAGTPKQKLTRAYHVANDVEDMDAFLRWFNAAADVIDQHYGKGYFGLRLEWGFVDRDRPE